MSNEQESDQQTGEWKRQATVLRQLSPPSADFNDSQYPEWQRVLIWCFIILVLVGSCYFLLATGHRQGLISEVGAKWLQLSGGQEARVFSLPPPPPKVVEPTVINSDPFIIDMSDGGFDDTYSVLQEEEVKAPVRPLKNEAFQTAFRILLTESDVAGDLVADEIEGIKFKEWNPVQQESSELWLEVVGVEASSGREQKFIWLVNVQTNEIIAKSQAARDLERNRPLE